VSFFVLIFLGMSKKSLHDCETDAILLYFFYLWNTQILSSLSALIVIKFLKTWRVTDLQMSLIIYALYTYILIALRLEVAYLLTPSFRRLYF